MQDAMTLTSVPSSHKTSYVLDTNVLIHDPNAVLNFKEHQVVIPITVLEELDKLKANHRRRLPPGHPVD